MSAYNRLAVEQRLKSLSSNQKAKKISRTKHEESEEES